MLKPLNTDVNVKVFYASGDYWYAWKRVTPQGQTQDGVALHFHDPTGSGRLEKMILK